MAIKDYSITPDLNTQISGINIAEGCAPSGINNAIRQLMADVKAEKDSRDTQAGAQSAKDAEQDAAIAAAQTAANNAASAASAAQTTANSKQDKLGYTPVKSVNGEDADSAGNVSLSLFTGNVTSRYSEDLTGFTSKTITVSGLTSNKPLFVVMKLISGGNNLALRIISGGSLNADTAGVYGGTLRTNTAGSVASGVVIPTGTSVSFEVIHSAAGAKSGVQMWQ